MRFCVSTSEINRRVWYGLEERLWQSRRQRQAERVAIAACILDRDDACLSGDIHGNDASGGRQFIDRSGGVDLTSSGDFFDR